MINICTSIKQSKKLLSLGLDPSTADMHYLFFKDTGHIVNKAPFVTTGDEVREGGLFTYVDCWSLAALLELMPMVKMCHYDLHYCQYVEEGEDFPIHSTAEYNNPLDAAFEMVCWLIKRGYIKVNK